MDLKEVKEELSKIEIKDLESAVKVQILKTFEQILENYDNHNLINFNHDRVNDIDDISYELSKYIETVIDDSIDSYLTTNTKIKGLYIESNKLPKVIEIENILESKQKLVGGNIECTYLMDDDEVVLICNEEGKMLGMDLNRDIGHDIIAGPFLIFKDNRITGDFESLTTEQINKYKKVFDEKSIENTQKKVMNILKNRKNEREDR